MHFHLISIAMVLLLLLFCSNYMKLSHNLDILFLYKRFLLMWGYLSSVGYKSCSVERKRNILRAKCVTAWMQAIILFAVLCTFFIKLHSNLYHDIKSPRLGFVLVFLKIYIYIYIYIYTHTHTHTHIYIILITTSLSLSKEIRRTFLLLFSFFLYY